MLRETLLAVALAASMSTAASAQSVQQTLGDFGLLGNVGDRLQSASCDG